MKKGLIKYILTLVFSIGIGFGIGKLISFLQMDYINRLNINDAFCIAIAFIIALIVAVTIHEMAHAIYFVIHGIRIRLFAVFFLCFDNCLNKLRIRFYPNKITSLGGLVIPNLPPINNKEMFETVRKIYYKDLLIAPIVSGVLALMSIASLFLGNSIFNEKGISFSTAFLTLFVFTNLMIFFSSFIKTENIFGDFPAYYIYKNNDRIAKLQICQYLFFNDSWEETVDESQWCINEIKRMVNDQDAESLDVIDLQLLDWIIQMDYINKVTIDEKTLNLMTWIIASEDEFLAMPKSENRDVLFYHILYSLLKYDYISDSDAKMKIDSLSANLLKNHPSKDYYTHLSNHIFGESDNGIWLNNNTNPNAAYSFLRIFPAIEYIENQLINNLKK